MLIRELAIVSILAVGASGQAMAQDLGADLYARNCASCHGPNLEGGGLGPPLSPSSYRYGGQQDDFIRIIRNGIISQGMPSFGATLTEEEIAAIAAFLPDRRSVPAPEQQETEEVTEPARRKFDPIPGVVNTLDYAVRTELFAQGLETIWAMAFIDEDTALLTERAGRLRVIGNGALVEEPVGGTPTVFIHSHVWNQGGLLDVAVDPNYPENGWIYLAYSHQLPGSGWGEEVDRRDETPEEVLARLNRGGSGGAEPLAMTRVVRGRIRDNRWVDEEILFEADPSAYGEPFWHYGGRMAFDTEGRLYFSVGDRGARDQARELARPTGKIHRLMPDGSVPGDNPFRRRKNALPSIFSFGHRNPQGMALEPSTGRIWASEHGPRGGDELNIITAGGDYGWPIATYGINYDGTILTPDTRAAGVAQPVYYWRPSIGVAGIAFYEGDEFPLWRGKILVCSLARRELRLLTIDDDRVQHEEVILRLEGRPYEAVVGPDGAIYVVTDDPGQVIRLTAQEERRQ